MHTFLVGGDHEIGALAREAFGNRRTDTAACTRNDHGLVFEALHSLYPFTGARVSAVLQTGDTCLLTRLQTAAEMIPANSDAFSEAPPTSAPSTLRSPKIASALDALTEPP